MGITNSIAKNILNFSISSWVNFIIGIASTFILTRIFLPEVLGVINLFYSTISALLSVFCFGLDSSLIRFYYEPPQPEHKSKYIFKLIVPCVISTIFIGILTFVVLGNDMTKFLFGEKETSLFICLIIGILDQVFLRYLNIIYRMEVDARNFNFQSIVINIVTKLSVILGAIIDRNSAVIAIIINIICVSTITIYYLYKQKRSWLPNKIDFNYKGYSNVFQFAFFSWTSMFLLQGWNLSSQLIINNCLDLKAVGIYSSASIFTAILAVAKTGFCTYWSAFMFQYYQEESKRAFILKMHDIILFLCIILSVLLFSFRSVLYLFIGEEFRASKEFFSLLLLFPMLQVVQETTGYGISIKKKNHILSIIMAFVLLLNTLLGLLGVKYFGLNGVAWANFISACISYIIITSYSQLLFKSITSRAKSFLGLLLLMSICMLPFLIADDIKLTITLMAMLFLSSILYCNEIKVLISIILKYLK